MSKTPPSSFARPSQPTRLGLAGETPWEPVLGLLPPGLGMKGTHVPFQRCSRSLCFQKVVQGYQFVLLPLVHADDARRELLTKPRAPKWR